MLPILAAHKMLAYHCRRLDQAKCQHLDIESRNDKLKFESAFLLYFSHAAFVGSTPTEDEIFIYLISYMVEKDKCRCYRLRKISKFYTSLMIL